VFGLPEGLTAEMLGRGAAPQTKEQMTAYLGRIYHETATEQTVEAEVEYKKSIGDTKTIQAMAISIANGEDLFTKETVAAITKPTLLIHGVSDGVVPVVASENLAKIMPNAQLVTFEQSGHWPQLEEAELFNQTINDFMAK
jgi:pimeloyl-ACP methyl ester carboxylesterase